jgi:hypothetical protein
VKLPCCLASVSKPPNPTEPGLCTSSTSTKQLVWFGTPSGADWSRRNHLYCPSHNVLSDLTAFPVFAPNSRSRFSLPSGACLPCECDPDHANHPSRVETERVQTESGRRRRRGYDGEEPAYCTLAISPFGEIRISTSLSRIPPGCFPDTDLSCMSPSQMWTTINIPSAFCIESGSTLAYGCLRSGAD